MLALVTCPPLSMADQHDPASESQQAIDAQNQTSPTLTQQDIRNTFTVMFSEQEEMLMDRYTVPLAIFGILLIGILIFFICKLLQHRSFKQRLTHLESTLGKIETSLKTSSNVSNNSPDTEAVVQVLTEIAENLRKHSFDLELLHRTLTVGTETLNHIADTLQNHLLPQSQSISSFCQDIEKSPEASQSEPNNQMSPILQEFCKLYNTGKTSELQEHYQPSYRIGVDASERRQNPDGPLAFETDSAGNFLAYSIDSEDLYAVVPRHNLFLQDSLYGPGAFSKVFECLGFTPQNRHQIWVVQPAYFKPDSAKETWTLEQRGILELEVI